jgi:drug/metabolite transporter (DMT)-like permease
MVVTRDVKSTRHLYSGVAMAAAAHIIMAFGILMVRDVFREISLVWVAGFRFTVATIMLAVFALMRGEGRLLLVGFQRKDSWKTMIPMSILGPFLATLFWIAGFKYETAGRAAIYNQMSTVFIILLAWLLLREEMTKRKLLGLSLAIGGAVLVAWK